MIPVNVFQYHNNPVANRKGDLAEINTADPIFYVKEHLDGTKEAKFHMNFLDLIERAFMEDGNKFFSVEQNRFLVRFFKQAGEATDRIQELWDKEEAKPSEIQRLLVDVPVDIPLDELEEVYGQLDDFLGSYLGEESDERYARC